MHSRSQLLEAGDLPIKPFLDSCCDHVGIGVHVGQLGIELDSNE
jgi:hypothetical protein